MRMGWIAACAAGMLLLPGSAVAADFQWQVVADPAPGATGLDGSIVQPPRIEFTVANGTPYLAELSRSPDFALTLYRTTADRSGWTQLGGVLNEEGTLAGSADFATAGSTVWIAWDDRVADTDSSEVHVARVTSSGVSEVRGSPIADASTPDIAYFGGRLYLRYQSPGGTRVVRTRGNGRGFEPARRFEDRAEALRIGNTVYSLASSGGESPGAPIFIHVLATRHGVTTQLPDPAAPGDNVLGMSLAVSNGTLWVQWIEGGPSDMAPPFVPHVARLVRR